MSRVYVYVGVVLAALTAQANLARAQAFNVDFGMPANKPADTYAAAGLPGVWNSIEGQSGTTYALVGLDGRPTGVTLTQTGATSLLSTSDPSVSGNDAALLNDALITNIAGQEVCLGVHGLQPGMYEVLIYAWMPNAPNVRSRARQDLSTMTIDVGGAWTGTHLEGVTYARWILTIDSSGFLGSHSGIVPGAIASNGAALNAIQIRPLVSGNPDAASSPDAGSTAPDAAIDARISPPGTDGGMNPSANPTGDSGGCAMAGTNSDAAAQGAAVIFLLFLTACAWRRTPPRHAGRFRGASSRRFLQIR
jgi:hypothetical protein